MSEPAMETAGGFGLTAERLFADLWSRDVISMKERRLILLGLLVGQGLDDMIGVQIDAALRTGDVTAGELREIVVFLTHYAGWTRGSRLNAQVEELIERVSPDRSGGRGPAG
jgi:4-carboxymuconolactone decarboxylase